MSIIPGVEEINVYPDSEFLKILRKNLLPHLTINETECFTPIHF